MRQIVLDTETTGLLFYEGHRIIEIGCIEINNRQITNKTFQTYLNPQRLVDYEAKKITGITDEFLKTQPLFKKIANKFLNFIEEADELIIHNANFDINFLNNELRLSDCRIKDMKTAFKIFDTLNFARKIHPGKKNSLNALCERYNIENKHRIQHGALLDAQLLAQVYIEMTTKRTHIVYKNEKIEKTYYLPKEKKIDIIKANKQELEDHIKYITKIRKHIEKKQND